MRNRKNGIKQAAAPTLKEFKDACVTEFEFLTKYHGFQVAKSDHQQCANPFEVQFERSSWRFIVEGLSYGFALGLRIQAPDGRWAWLGGLAPAEVAERIRSEHPRGQLGDIACAARLFREFGVPMIQGDWTAFEEIIRKQEERAAAVIKQREKQITEDKLNRAIVVAKENFKAAEYGAVVTTLSPYAKILPSTEKKRLEIAKERLREKSRE